MKFRRLGSDHDFELYQKGFELSFFRLSGKTATLIPYEYLKRSQVIGLFDKNKMVGGYIVGTSQPLRLLEFVPPDVLKAMPPPQGKTWDDCSEITCAWKLPEVSALFMSLFFWPHSLFRALATGKKRILGHDQNERLDELYTQSGVKTLYLGVSTFGFPSRLFTYSLQSALTFISFLWFVETPRRQLHRWKKKFKRGLLHGN